MLVWIVLAVLFLLLLASLPMYPYSRRWRHYPSVLITFITIIFLVLILAGLI